MKELISSDNDIFYIIVSAIRRPPNIKDILDALQNPNTKRYTQLGDMERDWKRMVWDDECHGIFGITENIIYSSLGCERPTISYYKDFAVNKKDYVWICRHKDYVHSYDKNGYYFGNIGRLGFIPNQRIELKNIYGQYATLFPATRYGIGHTATSIKSCYYIKVNDKTFYKSVEFVESHGTVIEHWSNDDAEFDTCGNLLSTKTRSEIIIRKETDYGRIQI